VNAFSKIKYQPNVLAWTVDVKTYKIYYHFKNSLTEQFPFDSKHYCMHN